MNKPVQVSTIQSRLKVLGSQMEVVPVARESALKGLDLPFGIGDCKKAVMDDWW